MPGMLSPQWQNAYKQAQQPLAATEDLYWLTQYLRPEDLLKIRSIQPVDMNTYLQQYGQFPYAYWDRDQGTIGFNKEMRFSPDYFQALLGHEAGHAVGGSNEKKADAFSKDFRNYRKSYGGLMGGF